MLVRMEGRGRPSYYNIGDEPGASEIAAPRVAASSPMSNLSALENQHNQNCLCGCFFRDAWPLWAWV